MLGIWNWIEQSDYAAFMRGIRRGLDELQSAPVDVEPVPRLTFSGEKERKK